MALKKEQPGMRRVWIIIGLFRAAVSARSLHGLRAGRMGWIAYTLKLTPSCKSQMEPHTISTMEKVRMKHTTMGP